MCVNGVKTDVEATTSSQGYITRDRDEAASLVMLRGGVATMDATLQAKGAVPDPTGSPTSSPTPAPTDAPTLAPTDAPTPAPTATYVVIGQNTTCYSPNGNRISLGSVQTIQECAELTLQNPNCGTGFDVYFLQRNYCGCGMHGTANSNCQEENGFNPTSNIYTIQAPTPTPPPTTVLYQSGGPQQGNCLGFDLWRDLYVRPCSGNINQQWTFSSGAIKNEEQENMCLTNGGGWPKLNSCDGSASQTFSVTPTGQIKNGNTCLQEIAPGNNRMFMGDCTNNARDT
jgi:hypothetical protein